MPASSMLQRSFRVGAFATGIVIAVAYAMLAAKRRFPSLDWYMFTRDPVASLEKSHPIVGFISNIGVVLWIGAAAALLAAAVALHGRAEKGVARTLWLAGLLTAALGLDDLFMLHELFGARSGYPELLLIGLYGLLAALYVGWSGRLLLERSPWPVLVLAFIAFAASLYVDTLPETWHRYHHVIEDGFKFFGIALWASFHFVLTVTLVRGALPPPAADEPQ